MRISSDMFTNTLVGQLNNLQTEQLQLQSQEATGQLIQNPSDNPAAAQQVLDLQAQNQSLAQFQTNISNLQTQATTSYDAMTSLQKVVSNASEIATEANGTVSQQQLDDYATQVGQLIQQAVQTANTQFNGEYLFGGTANSKPPFVATTNSSGQVTGVTYQGNTSVAESEIAPGVTVSAQTLGANTTGSGPTGLFTDSRTGADLFNHLIALQNALLSGNTSAISSTINPQITADDNNITTQVAGNASVQANLTAQASLATNRAAGITQQISNLADANLSQTLVSLSQTQTSYQAAMQSAGQIMGMSLLDYLP